MSIARPLIAVLIALPLVSCGGGGGSSPAPAQPSNGSVVTQNANATFVIEIPSATNTAARAGRNVVPSDTQSISIVIAAINGAPPPPGTQTVFTATLTLSNPNCSSASGGLACSVPVSVPSGQVTFAVSLYSSTNETGNAIASVTSTQPIVAGQNNTVDLSPLLVGGNLTIRLATPAPVAGAATQVTVSITEYDTTGGAIVGTYPNPISLADSDTTGATTLEVNGAARDTVTASTDTISLAYSGLAIVPVTISASTTGMSTVDATFAPSLPAIVLAPSSLAFFGTQTLGNAQPAHITTSQAGWTGSFGHTLSVTDGTPPCGLGASNATAIISLDTLAGTSFSATPQNAGTCVLLFHGGANQTTPLPVTVTTTKIIVQHHHP